MKKTVFLILLCVLFIRSAAEETHPGADRVPNRFARLFPTHIGLEKKPATGETILTFTAHNYDSTKMIRVEAWTIPADAGSARITYPGGWFGDGEKIAITYTVLTGGSEPVLLVIRMQDEAGFWRNWNIAFYR